MKKFCSFYLIVAVVFKLAIVAHGNEWTPSPDCQSRKHAFVYDDSDLQAEVSALWEEFQQSCYNETSIQQLQNEFQQLHQVCNMSVLATEISQLREEISILNDSITAIPPLGSLSNPATNCNEIFQQDSSSSTGIYWLSNGVDIVSVTCDFDVQLPPPSPVSGWQEIANIDLNNPTDSCPSPLKETTTSPRRCERASSVSGCESVVFPTEGVPFSKLCGRAVGYGVGSADALDSVRDICSSSGCETINDPYVDGVSITYSSNNARVHVWTFVAQTRGSSSRCPCGNAAVSSPSFVGDSYYCEVAQSNSSPLWEGEGCTDHVATDAPCCENPNLPWFYREFDQPIVTEDIEVRVCTDQNRGNEDFEFDVLKLYIQ